MALRVRTTVESLCESGALDPMQLPRAMGNREAASIASIQQLTVFPLDVSSTLRDAYTQGTALAFLSLVPWCGVAFILSFFVAQVQQTPIQNTVDDDIAVPEKLTVMA